MFIVPFCRREKWDTEIMQLLSFFRSSVRRLSPVFLPFVAYYSLVDSCHVPFFTLMPLFLADKLLFSLFQETFSDKKKCPLGAVIEATCLCIIASITLSYYDLFAGLSPLLVLASWEQEVSLICFDIPAAYHRVWHSRYLKTVHSFCIDWGNSHGWNKITSSRELLCAADRGQGVGGKMSFAVPFSEGWFLGTGPETAAPGILSLPWTFWVLTCWSQHLGTKLFEIRTNVGYFVLFYFCWVIQGFYRSFLTALRVFFTSLLSEGEIRVNCLRIPLCSSVLEVITLLAG